MIGSWLLDLTATALARRSRRSRTSRAASPTRARAAGRRSRPIDEGVPAHVLTAALYERFSSRGEADYADKLLSAMRKQFGGHHEQARAAVSPEPPIGVHPGERFTTC